MDISDRESTKKKADAEPVDIDEEYSASIVEGSLNSENSTESIIFTEDFDVSETVSVDTENTESTDIIRAHSRKSSSVESSDIEETIEEVLHSTVNWQVAFSLATDIVADISHKVTEHFTKIEKIQENVTNLKSMKTENISIKNTESSDVDRAYSESAAEEALDIDETKRKIKKFLKLSKKSQIGFSKVNNVVADISDKVSEELIEIEKTQKSVARLKLVETVNIKISPVKTEKITISEPNDLDRANLENYVEEFKDKEDTLKVDIEVPKTISAKIESTESTDVTPKSTNIEKTCSFIRIEEQKNVDKFEESIVELDVATNIQMSTTEIANTTEKITISEPNDLDRANLANDVEEFKDKEDTLKLDIEVPKTISAKIESTESTDVTPKSANIAKTCSFIRIEEQKNVDKFEESIVELDDATNTQISTTEIATTFKSINEFSDCEIELAKFVDSNENVIEYPASKKSKGFKDSSKFKWVRNHTAEADNISSFVEKPSEKPKHIFKSPEHYKEFIPKSLTTGRPTSPCLPEPKKVPPVDLCSSNKEFVPKSSLNVNSKVFVPKSLRIEPPTSSGLPNPKEVSAGSLNVTSKEFVPRLLRVQHSTFSGLPKPNEVHIGPLKVEPLSSGLSKPKEVSSGSLNVNTKEFVPKLLRVEPFTSSGLPKPNEVHIGPLKVEPLSSGLPKPKEVSAGPLNINSKEFEPRSLRTEASTSSGLPKPNKVHIEPLKVEPLSSCLSESKEVSTESLNLNSTEFVPRSLRAELSTSSGLPKPNEINIDPLKVEPLSSSDLPKPNEVCAEPLNFNSKEFIPRSLRVELSTSPGLPESNEVPLEPLEVEPLSSLDLSKPMEVSAESLNLNSTEFLPRLLKVEPSTSSGILKPNEVPIEPLKVETLSSSGLSKPKEVSTEYLNSKEFVPRSLKVEASTSSGVPKSNEVPIEPLKVAPLSSSGLFKPKEVSAESLDLNYKEFAPSSLRVEHSTSDLPKPQKVSTDSLNLNYKEFAPSSLRVEHSTYSDLPKPQKVSTDSLNLNYKEFAPSSLRVEHSTYSDLPKPKKVSTDSLNLNYKEFSPSSLRVEHSTYSDLPKPKKVSTDSLNLNYKEFAPRSSRVEPSTSSDFPKPKEVSAESLNLNYKEFAPKSSRVEPSTYSDLPKPKEVSAESLNLNYKEFAPRSSRVEQSTSSDFPKPKEVSAESLNLNYKEFAPSSLRVEHSTYSDLPKPKEVSAESLNLNYKNFAPTSLRAEYTASSHLPIQNESLCSSIPMEVPVEVTTTVFDPKEVLTPEIPVHSFLATLDAVLLVLEGTLAGAYRISQNYTGPSIPLVIKNTMHSVRLSLETLRTHFGYTEQECFEPLSSILRDLLTPAVTLFSDICPELAYDIIDFYPVLNVSEPKPGVPIPAKGPYRPEFVISPRNIHGSTVYDRYPLPEPHCVPRIPLYMDSFEDTKLGVFVTPDGFIRMLLPYTFEIDLTIDGAICVRNIKDKTIAAISGCGNFSGMATGLCRVHQRGKVLELRITDEFSNKNMYGKIGVRGVYFGGTDTPANLHLKDNGETIVSPINFSDLDTDFIRDVFVNHSLNGPANYEACCAALSESKEKTLVDGSVHFCWRNIKITQYKNGELVVNRKNGDFMIWCSPEVLNPYTVTEKKGIIKVVTPMTRVVSTVMSTPIREHEKFFLANLGNQWVYYNMVDFLASNQGHSAGYTDVTEEKKAAEAARRGAQNF